MATGRYFALLVLTVLALVILLPGCVRFDKVADFEANILAGRKPLPGQFTLLAQGRIDTCLWNFGDGTFSSERSPVHTYSEAGEYTVTPCGGEPASVRKDDYITVTSGSGSAPTAMWCYHGDNERHRIWQSELVPPFEGQNPGGNEVLSQTIGVPRDFALRGTMLFWTDQAERKILATDLFSPNQPAVVTTVLTREAAPPYGLAIDPKDLNVSWVENDPGSDSFPPTSFRIMYANVNSSATPGKFLHWFTPIEDLAFDGVVRDLHFVGYHAPVEMVMDVPQDYGDYVIVRIGVDGGTTQDIVSENGQIKDIAIAQVGRKVYWYSSHLKVIRRANLDGSDLKTLISDLPGVEDLAVDDRTGGSSGSAT